jgi:hypothetical protein
VEIKTEDRPFDASMTMGKAPAFLKNNLMRMTMGGKNGSGLASFVKKHSGELCEFSLKNPEMKASGDTAADIYTSENSTSFVRK